MLLPTACIPNLSYSLRKFKISTITAGPHWQCHCRLRSQIANDTLLGVRLSPPTSSRRLTVGAGAGAASMPHVCEVFGPESGRTFTPALSITP